MMIKFWLGITLSIVIGFLLIFLFAFIAKKMKKTGAAGGVIGFFVGFALVVVAAIVPSRVYVVSGDGEYTHYLILGNGEYKLSNDETVNIEIPSGKCMVINDTEGTMVVEEIIYGGFSFGGDNVFVKPHSSKYIKASKIDYFFEDSSPPNEISVKGGEKQVKRMWLRKKREKTSE